MQEETKQPCGKTEMVNLDSGTSTVTPEVAISDTKTVKVESKKNPNLVHETMDDYDDVVMPSQEEDKPTTSDSKNGKENTTEKSKKGRKRGRESNEEQVDEEDSIGDGEHNESAENDDGEYDEEEESDEDSVEDDGEREYDSNDSDYGAPRYTRPKRRRRGAASTGESSVRGRHSHGHENHITRRTSSRSSSPQPAENTEKNGKTQAALDTGSRGLGPRQSRHERVAQHQQREDSKKHEKVRGPMVPHFEEGYRYPFVVNKWVSIRSFGNFDEFDSKNQKLPAAYGPPMVCKKLESTLWPIGFTSLRLFHDFTGNGAMRRYICTVRADREHPPALVWRIQALDVETEYVEAQDPAVLMDEFRSRFAVLKDNPIHNSWLCDAEHFFAIVHKDVISVVHCLPHHNEVLKLLSPGSPLPELPQVPRVLPKEPFSEDVAATKPKRTPRRRDPHTCVPSQDAAVAKCARSSTEVHTSEKPSSARNHTTGLTPLQTLQEKAKLEALHSTNAFVWASLPPQPQQQQQQQQQQRKTPLLSSQWDSTAHRELERLEDLLGRAEQVIYSLGETNNQLRMLNRIYAQQRHEPNLSGEQQQHPITL